MDRRSRCRRSPERRRVPALPQAVGYRRRRFPVGLGHPAPDAVGLRRGQGMRRAPPPHRAAPADRLRRRLPGGPPRAAFAVGGKAQVGVGVPAGAGALPVPLLEDGTGEPAGIRPGPSPRRWLGRPTHGRPARRTRAAALRCRPSGRCRPAAPSRPGRPVLDRISEAVAEPPGGSATGGSGPPMGASAQLNGGRARRSPKPARSSVAPGRWRIEISPGRSEPAGGSLQVGVIRPAIKPITSPGSAALPGQVA